MSKRKSKIEIGQRAYSETQRLFPNKSMDYVALRIGCNKKSIAGWRDGFAPSGMFLARLLYLGADVIWILTGERSGDHGQSL